MSVNNGTNLNKSNTLIFLNNKPKHVHKCTHHSKEHAYTKEMKISKGENLVVNLSSKKLKITIKFQILRCRSSLCRININLSWLG